MNKIKEPILQIPENVKTDTFNYHSEMRKFVSGQTSPEAFRAYRVPMGIYEQRTPGNFMVRVRVGAGIALGYQLQKIADLSSLYGNGIVHLTTRQDIQIHQVKIEDTAKVIQGLFDAGLSSRGGGGNTVRNVTACPQSGFCPNEKFDVAGYAVWVAQYLMQFKDSYTLPRKYKISFSGCSSDCAIASVSDLGFFAHNKDDRKGFSVYAAGGLGANPAVAIKIEDFVSDYQVLEVAEAIKRVFDKYGDRENKHKARLRYVLRKLGEEEFIKLYKAELRSIRKQGLAGDIPMIKDISLLFEPSKNTVEKKISYVPSADNIIPEKNKDFYTIRVNLRLGDISADNLYKISSLAEEYGTGIVRTTQSQNLLITSVHASNVQKVISEIDKVNLGAKANCSAKIVACTGASTCRLGICLSRGLADAIADKFSENNIDPGDTKIKISGCRNSCGHHYLADIGFQGRAKKVNGKLMPYYEVLAGAKRTEGKAQLAKKIGAVPAKQIPQMLIELFKKGKIDNQSIKALAAKYAKFEQDPVPEGYYYDYGSDKPFSLSGRGPGECSACASDTKKCDNTPGCCGGKPC